MAITALKCGTNEEGHLSGEDEFVTLEETTCGVDKDGIRDAVDQVHDSLLHLLSRLRAINCLLEHHAERLHTVFENTYSVFFQISKNMTFTFF